MKLTILIHNRMYKNKTRILFIVALTLFCVSGHAQQQRVRIAGNNVTLKAAFKQIEQQSNLSIDYNAQELDDSGVVRSLPVEGTVQDVLPKILPGRHFDIKYQGSHIVITRINDNNTQREKIISGTVTDENGDPIIGANIVEKGTTNGLISDQNGKFSLSVAPGAVIQVTYIGFMTKEFTVGAQLHYAIRLEEDNQTLDEVIVIGYGTARRREFTGSVSSVKLENSPAALMPNLNVLESLKGNVSGLNVGATAGVGSDPEMLIRGQNSINESSNKPLIVLDGVIYMGEIGDINPSDVASIDVLKDAVSAAAYGTRAGNGIIAITTMKGQTDKPVITLNANAGVHAWQKRPKVMGTEEWIRKVNTAGGYSEGETSWMKPGELANYQNGVEQDWFDEISRTGTFQDYQLSVSGRGKGVNYYLSTAYEESHHVIKGDDYNRISVFGKINTDITDWLNIGVDARYSRRDYSGVEASVNSAFALTPVGVIYRDEEGNLEKYPREIGSTNALWDAKSGTRDNKDIRQNFRLNAYATVQVPWVKGLSYRLNFQPNLDLTETGNFYHEGYYITEGAGLERYSPAALENLLAKANGDLQNTKTYSYVVDNIITYKNRFGLHDVEATLVATRDEMKYTRNQITGSDFASAGSTTLGSSGLHYATVQKFNLNGAYRKANIGYLARANYGFNSRYYLTASVRRDGASVFGSNTKWGTFASVGAAWRISEERFLKNFKPLDNLKLKFSWGQNGNQAIDPYATLSKVQNGPAGGIRYEFSDTGDKIYYGLVQSNMGNYNLGWESTDALNTGFESIWLNNRLFVDIDIYHSKTYDQLFSRVIPSMTGFSNITTSMGQVNNTGVELTVNSVNVQNKDWRWSTSVTYWKNKNKLVKLYGEDIDGDGKEDDDIGNSLFIGKSLGVIYGFKQIGIVQEDDAEYMELTGALPGNPKYADLDGKPGITNDDRTILGYSKENFRLNMSNTVRYKNFELYIMLVGIFGGNNYYMKENPRAFQINGSGMFMDNTISIPYWTPENKSNTYPSATFTGDNRFKGLQSRTFVRVQDVSLSYTFDRSLLKSVNINNLKVYLTAKNPLIFTKWEGVDAETGRRYNDGNLPVLSTYSLGVNISF